MARRKTKRTASPGETELLGILWENGPLTLAETHRAVGRPIGYTTVQTRLNRLVTKGLATRSTDRPASYRAAVSPEDVGASALDALVERVTRGAVVPLVAHLVRDRSLTRDEIDELRRLVDQAEGNLAAENHEADRRKQRKRKPEAEADS